MTISFQESYRFTYEFDGSEYAFHVLADSEDLAKRKAESMAHASFFGKLEDGTTNIPQQLFFFLDLIVEVCSVRIIINNKY